MRRSSNGMVTAGLAAALVSALSFLIALVQFSS